MARDIASDWSGSVPSCFRCPISLDLMKDPVSLCTGMTYDRVSIQKWLNDGNNSCPSTSQQLRTQELTPNHTLRRLINDWYSSNNTSPSCRFQQRPAERDVSSKPVLVDTEQVKAMLVDLKCGAKTLDTLKKLRKRAKESARNSRCIAEVGAAPILATILSSHYASDATSQEALAALLLLPMDESTKRSIASPKLVSAICLLLRKGSLQSKINASTLLELLSTDRDIKLAIGSTEGIFEGLVELLGENLNQMAIKSSLRALLTLCLLRRNRVNAVEADAVAALVELLPDADRATSENALAVLEILCRCAEGRGAVSQHALAIPAISKKIFIVSDLATEYAVRTLWAVCKHSPDDDIQKRAVEAGVFSKLLLMLQMDFSSSTKHKMGDLLKLLCNIRKHCPDVAIDDNIPRLDIF